MNLNKLSSPSQTYLTDVRLVAIIGWVGAQAWASGWAVTLRDVHLTVIDVYVDSSIALEYMHSFGLISLSHPVTVIATNMSQSCGVPEWRQRKSTILLCSYRKGPLLPVFRVAQMHVCEWWKPQNESWPALFCWVQWSQDEASLCSKWGSSSGSMLSQHLWSLPNPTGVPNSYICMSDFFHLVSL